jgi:hypothetical protein
LAERRLKQIAIERSVTGKRTIRPAQSDPYLPVAIF